MFSVWNMELCNKILIPAIKYGDFLFLLCIINVGEQISSKVSFFPA